MMISLLNFQITQFSLYGRVYFNYLKGVLFLIQLLIIMVAFMDTYNKQEAKLIMKNLIAELNITEIEKIGVSINNQLIFYKNRVHSENWV